MDSYTKWPNLAAMMFDLARRWPSRPMLRYSRDGRWRRITWGTFGQTASSVARGLLAAGISPGDRVLILSENRPEYPIAETALFAIRAVPLPTYTTSTEDDLAHILRDSGATAAIVSNQALAARLMAAVGKAPGLDLMIGIETPPIESIRFIPWDTLTHDERPIDDIAAAAAGIAEGTLACLIYTSGTSGSPRGVMLPHRAILANCRGAFEFLRPMRLHNELYLSFLPLSHSYEHTVGQFFLLSIGTEIAYSRGVEHLSADLLEIRPTILAVVPRILEVIRSRILAQVARERPWRQALFSRALENGRKKAEREPLSLIDRLIDPLLERLVRRKVLARFGGRFFAAICGGARLDPIVGRFYLGLGIVLMQGYGQTEAGPVISANPPNAIHIDTVGPPLDGVEVRIATDGEIEVRGELVMDGYWGRPEETARVMNDGWLATGDIGEIDANGYLRITDRKRDIIVLSGGENVSPARVEGTLVAAPAIAQAVVCGDGKAGLAALLVPAEGQDEAAVNAALSAVNKTLTITERIRRHALVPPFTIENGLLTASQKVRRHLVLRRHAEIIEQLW